MCDLKGTREAAVTALKGQWRVPGTGEAGVHCC